MEKRTTKLLLLFVTAALLVWTFKQGGSPFLGEGTPYLAASILSDSTMSVEDARTITFALALLFITIVYYFGFEIGPDKGFIRQGGRFVMNPFRKK